MEPREGSNDIAAIRVSHENERSGQIGGNEQVVSFLMGPDWIDQYRRAAVYVDRILKGEKPADLPVAGAYKVRAGHNHKTAKALGITGPQSPARADELIE